MKLYHDRKLVKKNFQPGQYLLLFNSRLKLFAGKLKSKWFGPFRVKEIKHYGVVEIEDLVKNESPTNQKSSQNGPGRASPPWEDEPKKLAQPAY
jgi:hypothetical protein